MNNQLATFIFEGASVQVIDKNNKPWFLAKDVCEILEIVNTTQAIAKLDDDERAMLNIGRQGDANIIDESGLYSLIMTSRKLKAKRFKKWVTSEVLPSIRKTGSYSITPIDPMALFSDPAAMLQLATDYAKRLIEKDEVIAQQAPKVAALARLSESEGSLNITESAKTLGIQRNKLFSWLDFNGWIYRRAGSKNWLGYRDKEQRGYLTHKVKPILLSDGTERISEQVRITPKGLAKLAEVVTRHD